MKTGTKVLIGAGVGLGSIYGISLLSADLMRRGMNTHVAVTPIQHVSVIIKNLNEEASIGRCIESLLNQSVILEHPEMFEILLVDGGSTDRSLEIAGNYPIRIILTKRGVLHQKNVGIMNTTGDLIAFADSDSYYPPYWLAHMIPLFDDQDIVLVWTPSLVENSSDVIWGLVALANHARRHALAGGTMVRRSVFEQTGLYDEDYDCVMFSRVRQEEEYNFVERARTVGKVYYQQENPFVSNTRRFDVIGLKHECIHDPKNVNCPFAQEVGVSRF